MPPVIWYLLAMAESVEIRFLGTGTSHGVPMINCDCPVCRSVDPRDRRNRSSAAIVAPDGRVILIDTSPELRLSAVACDLRRADAILFTHSHADHIMGFDDIRRFNDAVGRCIPCYADAATVAHLRKVFGYAELPYEKTAMYRPCATFEVMDGPRDICGLNVAPIPLLHGNMPVLGFRIGGLAYCTDVSAIPDESMAALQGLDLLVLDALRHTSHPTHFNVREALEVIERLRPRRALLTHITHELMHEPTSRQLPENVGPAYDTLRVRVDL